jgi:hypothetical protein
MELVVCAGIAKVPISYYGKTLAPALGVLDELLSFTPYFVIFGPGAWCLLAGSALHVSTRGDRRPFRSDDSLVGPVQLSPTVSLGGLGSSLVRYVACVVEGAISYSYHYSSL